MLRRVRDLIQNREGYSLVIVAALFAAFAIVVASYLDRTEVTQQLDRQVTNQGQMGRIASAMAQYQYYNGRYPCPARVDLVPTDTNFGLPVANCESGTPSGIIILTGSTQVISGMAPVRALAPYGVDVNDAFDTWNNRIMYVVNRNLTPSGSGTATTYPTVTQTNLNSTLMPPPYLLLSYGPDHRGAYLRSQSSTSLTAGPSIPCSGSDMRSENCNNDLIFRTGASFTPTNSDTATYYDDQVLLSATDITTSGLVPCTANSSYSWTGAGGGSCAGSLPSLTSGQSITLSHCVSNGNSGAVTVTCQNGILSQTNKTCQSASGSCAGTGNCAAQTASWNTNCSGSVPNLVNNSSSGVSNTASGYNGSAVATCRDGALSINGISCTPLVGCSAQTVNWNTNCSASSGSLASGGSSSITNSASGYTGAVTIACSNGVLSQSGPSCTAVANNCATQAVSWGSGCTGTATAFNNGATTSVTNSAAGRSGTATATCTNGTATASGTCDINCTAANVTWSTNCVASAEAINHGATANLVNTASGYTGAATAACNQGVVSTSGTSCATIAPEGDAYCWGYNANNQLGGADTADIYVPVRQPFAAGVTKYKTIRINQDVTCALATNGRIYCWGTGSLGQLGNSASASSAVPVAVTLPSGVTSFTALDAGSNFACGLGNNGLLYCWGSGWSGGQLGNGADANSNVPVAVTLPSGVTSFTAFSTGYGHSCAIGNNGLLYCWGSGGAGNLGNNNTINSNVPVQATLPTGVTSFTALSMGNNHGCAIGNNGRAYCWGSGNNGRLGGGAGIISDRLVPTLVVLPSGVTSFTSISLGTSGSCAIGNNARAYCWGTGTNGSMGNNTTTTTNGVPQLVDLPSGVTSYLSVSGGDGYNCGKGNNNRIYCWGLNNKGQLGDGTTTQRNVPTLVAATANLSSYFEVDAGRRTTCAITPPGCTGQIVSWGSGCSGTSNFLASGSASITSTSVGYVGTATATCVNGSLAVSASSCATRSSRVYCSGFNSQRQLGNNSNSNSSVPVQTTLPSGVSSMGQVSSGSNHSCGLGNNGLPYCWGSNNNGQIGDGTTTVRGTPVAVTLPSGVTGFAPIANGHEYSCGIGNNGLPYCWGVNGNGRLGDGTTTTRYTPVAVTLPSGVTGFTTITTGYSYSCGLGSNNGRAYCWGLNGNGQLGDGTVAARLTPVAVTMTSGVTGFTAIASVSTHSCGLGYNGRAYCWGSNASGQIGDNTTTQSTTPVAVTLPSGVTGFTTIAVGVDYSCGIGNNGLPYCWGINGSGQLGDGTTTNRSVPTAVTLPGSVTSFKAISTYNYSTCGIGNDDRLYCWGLNTYGQLGDGTTTNRSVPTLVPNPSGITSFIDVDPGQDHVCATGAS